MLSHGIAPDELLIGTMIPLIKDGRLSKQCSDNYRALTIGTGLSKLLETVILNKQTDALKHLIYSLVSKRNRQPLCAHSWY